MFNTDEGPNSKDYHVFQDVEQLVKVVNSLFHNSFEPAILTSPEIDGHKMICVNPAFCKMTGYSESELIGKSPKMLQGERTNRKVMSKLRQDLVAGTPFHGAAMNYRKDATIYHVEWKINPVYDLNGKLLCFFSIQRDLSYLKTFLNRIKVTSEHVRELLKRVKKSSLSEQLDKGLEESIHQATIDEVSNSALFSPSLRTEANIDLFDSELFLDGNDPAGIMPVQAQTSIISAKEFCATTHIESEDIQDLCSMIEHCIHGVDLLNSNISHDNARQSLVKDLQEFANILFFMDEFVDLSTVLGELSRKLDDFNEPELPIFVTDILSTLFVELNAWLTTVFVEQTSENIHELDGSLIGSSRQLLMFL